MWRRSLGSACRYFVAITYPTICAFDSEGLTRSAMSWSKRSVGRLSRSFVNSCSSVNVVASLAFITMEEVGRGAFGSFVIGAENRTTSVDPVMPRICEPPLVPPARRDVDGRVPGVVDADEEQRERDAGHEVEGTGGVAEGAGAGDEQHGVGREGEADVPEPVLEDRLVARLPLRAVRGADRVDHADGAEECEERPERVRRLARDRDQSADRQDAAEVNDGRRSERLHRLRIAQARDLGAEGDDDELQAG